MLDTVHVSHCFHCKSEMPTAQAYTVPIAGEKALFCCHGCAGAAQLINSMGLDSFYDFREKCNNDAPIVNVEKSPLKPEDFERSVKTLADGNKELRLIVTDIRCVACVWLLEQVLRKQKDIIDVQINFAKRRMTLRYKPSLSCQTIVALILNLGYTPSPDLAGSLRNSLELQKKEMLTRLGVAGIGMMPVMMFALASYFAGDATAQNPASGMDPLYETLFRWASLALSLPVVFYSASPFHRGALIALSHRHLSMDFPVSLAILAAWSLSVFNTLTMGSTVYYDTACMFTFFLLIGRYVELVSQQHFQDNEDALQKLLPSTVTRVSQVNAKEVHEAIALSEVRANDLLYVRAGEPIAADGIVMSGQSSVSDTAFTGEALASIKSPGSRVLAGAYNHDAPLLIRAQCAAHEFLIEKIKTLYEEASAYRPYWSRLADRAATWFIASVLSLSVGAGLFWFLSGSPNYIVIALTVLVVACPCALSLAAPVASTVATTALRKKGLLIRDGSFLERLANISTVVFDKTGTLTQARLQLIDVITLSTVDAQKCLAIASALEKHSQHPIAQAFTAANDLRTSKVSTRQEGGIEGEINGVRYRIGKPAFACPEAEDISPNQREGLWVLLATTQPIAWFRLQDSVRQEASALIAELKSKGLKTAILSGDASIEGGQIAESLNVDEVHLGLSPEDKIVHIRRLGESESVLMVGDGVNDAGAMAASSCSIAIAPRDLVVQQSADATLLNPSLALLPTALTFAKRCQRVIRQNILWSLCYNLTAIPFALLGLLPPWLAALGMSASSVIVVLNANRLRRIGD